MQRWLSSGLTVLAVTLLVATGAQDRVVASHFENCAYTFTSGSGSTFLSWCVAPNGNILLIESPAFQWHLYRNVEGYTVCDASGIVAYDYAFEQAGFNLTGVISGCNGGVLPCVMQRDTTDGKYRLKMTYAQNKAEKAINVTMALKNLTGVTQSGVQIIRYGDAEVNSSSWNWTDRSERAVWSRYVDALVLSGTTFSGGLPVFARVLAGWSPPTTTCTPADVSPPPIGPADGAALVGYTMGNLNAGATKTVKFQYKRQ